MEIAEIAPLLRVDKITLTISAEKNGKLRVTYVGATMRRLWLLGIAFEAIP